MQRWHTTDMLGMQLQSSLSHYLEETEPVGVTPLNAPALLSRGSAMRLWSLAACLFATNSTPLPPTTSAAQAHPPSIGLPEPLKMRPSMSRDTGVFSTCTDSDTSAGTRLSVSWCRVHGRLWQAAAARVHVRFHAGELLLSSVHASPGTGTWAGRDSPLHSCLLMTRLAMHGWLCGRQQAWLLQLGWRPPLL